MRRRGGKKVDGTGGQDEQAHGGVNGLGQPVTLVPTAGQESDIGRAEARLAGHAPEGVIADEGYECEAVVEAVIPSRANRVGP